MNGWKKLRAALAVIGKLSLLLGGSGQANAANSWDAAWNGIDALYDGLTLMQAAVKQGKR